MDDATLTKAKADLLVDDGDGFPIGADPRTADKDAMRSLGHPESPIKAIRAKCVDCSGGSESEARKCVSIRCPLWCFRMGKNVFHARTEMTDEQRAAVTDRLQAARELRW